ncbi:hypothetical protein WJX84_000690 [Apatococcus fuscideae]|uniref:Peptidase M16C associated domain-containing protein n=1 Tax=Apatococcus fuscideae TaxID=2026836 RepID=A0AAW1T4X0_9CHLO
MFSGSVTRSLNTQATLGRHTCSPTAVPRLPALRGYSGLRPGVWRHRAAQTLQPCSKALLQARAFGGLSQCVRAAVAAPAPPQVESEPAPKELHGFSLVQQEFIQEYNSDVLIYRHDKTGAEVMSLVNDDENKTFGVVLRTPVENSKGIPHILEHSVLCGSRKYPIKEPFVELMKGSMQTFLNAFTYPDRTCYPVASANLQDFYNLVNVYLDAVLHPNCINDEKTFAQEGWHLELKDGKDDMTYKGVVFNEMKGVYSSPDSVNNRYTQTNMFPDNTYFHDSGGDPQVIPELTFKEFQDFHGRYYHPSNARFWFYGDDEPQERLRLLGSYLDEFDARPVDSTVHLQPLLKEPKQVTVKYAAGEQSEEPAKAFVSLNWVMHDEPLSLETELALEFLDSLMLGTAAAPLRKALNDSGLGEAIIGGGMQGELCQMGFSLGLKGVDPANADKVEQLIISELEKLAKTGFSKASIEAAVNSIEFDLRENNTGRFPRGLSLMLRSMSAWIYDRDPLSRLRWTEPLEHFKARLASGEDIFGPLIQKYLLKNSHRIRVDTLPDEELAAKQEADEKQRLGDIRRQMDQTQEQGVIAETLELQHRQETPDTAEALACVPTLQLEDIPKEAASIPTDISEQQNVTMLQHELFTNDVLYMETALDMRTLPPNLLPLIPLFCRSLTQMGTQSESFIDLTDRIGRQTGGLSFYPFISSRRGSSEPLAYLMVRGKAMAEKAPELLDVMRDILLTARLDDKSRFKQMVLETRAGLEAGVVSSGHAMAAARLDAQRSIAGWAQEQTGGLSYLNYVRDLSQRIDSDWEGIQQDLETIRKALLHRTGAVVNLTGDQKTLSSAAAPVREFLAALPEQGLSGSSWQGILPAQNEAITVPTQVNYVGKAGNLFEDAGYQLHGSSYVINKLLGTTWLWDRVRVSGGAYGGFCDFDNHSGMFTYLSYRDPNLLKTVDVYDGTADFLRNLQVDDDALTKAIIGTMGDVDGYQLPDAKGYTALMRHLLQVSDSERQQRREEILSTSPRHFKDFAEAIDAVKSKGQVVVVTSAERAQAVNDKERPGFFNEIIKVL